MEHVQKTSVPLFVRNGVNNLIYNIFLIGFEKKGILNHIQRKSEQHILNELVYIYCRQSEGIRSSEKYSFKCK